MPPAGIVGLGSHVPSKVMTNEDWTGLVETSDEWITTKTGIKERRIADPAVCTSDLAVIASQQAIEEELDELGITRIGLNPRLLARRADRSSDCRRHHMARTTTS